MHGYENNLYFKNVCLYWIILLFKTYILFRYIVPICCNITDCAITSIALLPAMYISIKFVQKLLSWFKLMWKIIWINNNMTTILFSSVLIINTKLNSIYKCVNVIIKLKSYFISRQTEIIPNYSFK